MGLFQQDLSSILGSFRRTIAKLERLADNNERLVKQNMDLTEALYEQSSALNVEASKARSVKEKLEALLA